MKAIDEDLAGVTYRQAADLIEKHFQPKYGETLIDEALLLAIELLREADSPKDEVTENESVEAEKWHDLRKDPTDLPREYESVIVSDIETDETYSGYYTGDGYWEADNGPRRDRIVAWQPFPEFYNPEEDNNGMDS